MSKIQPALLADISNRLGAGESSRQIAAVTGLSKSSINNARERLSESAPRLSGGRPRKLSSRDRNRCSTLVSRGAAKTAVQVARIINENRNREEKVSPDTVRRALKEANFKAFKMQNKPRLTELHRKRRRQWAEAHKDWTVEDWRRVVWSDETKINRICSDGKQYAWLQTCNSHLSQRYHETVKFGGGCIMIWGCMSWLGASGMAKVYGRMNKEQYVAILEKELLPSIAAFDIAPDMPSSDQVIFQQDNDPKHTSKHAREWFCTQGIKTLPWPANSPDMNPIEHLWSQIKKSLGSYPEYAKSMQELYERFECEWAKVTPEACQRLIASMPTRIKAVLKARGGHTTY